MKEKGKNKEEKFVVESKKRERERREKRREKNKKREEKSIEKMKIVESSTTKIICRRCCWY